MNNLVEIINDNNLSIKEKEEKINEYNELKINEAKNEGFDKGLKIANEEQLISIRESIFELTKTKASYKIKIERPFIINGKMIDNEIKTKGTVSLSKKIYELAIINKIKFKNNWYENEPNLYPRKWLKENIIVLLEEV